MEANAASTCMILNTMIHQAARIISFAGFFKTEAERHQKKLLFQPTFNALIFNTFLYQVVTKQICTAYISQLYKLRKCTCISGIKWVDPRKASCC